MFLFPGKTPLIYATKGGHLEIVEFLLNKGADIKDTDRDGEFLILYFIVY